MGNPTEIVKKKWKEKLNKELKEMEITPNQYQYIKDKIHEAKTGKYQHEPPTNNIRPKGHEITIKR